MADTYTTNLNLTKPEPGAAEDTWGISLNADLDSLDAIFSSSGTQINLNPNQINFADNKKAIFGTGNDLQIYHDGSNSIIQDSGAGNLQLRGASFVIMQSDDGENMVRGQKNAGVRLYYDGATKLATTSTGIDVTGTAVADNLHIDNTSGQLKISRVGSSGNGIYWDRLGTQDAAIQVASNEQLNIDNNFGNPINLRIGADGSETTYLSVNTSGIAVTGNNLDHTALSPQYNMIESDITGNNTQFLQVGGDLRIRTIDDSKANPVERLRIDHASGDISFYDNTGSTQGLFWDASAERLGLGTTSPTSRLTIASGSNSTNTGDGIHFFGTSSNNQAAIQSFNTGAYYGDLRFYTSNHATASTSIGDERLRIARNGDISFYEDTGTTAKLFWDASTERLGLGTTSPTSPLHVAGTVRIDGGGNSYIYSDASGVNFETSGARFTRFLTNSSERMRITSSGELLLNKTSASVGTDGVQLRPSSYSGFSATSATALFVNRNTNDGDAIEIGKNGVKVGSIGNNGSRLFAGSGATGLMYDGTNNYIVPWNTTTNAGRDGAIDLGVSPFRFKDLYLSGSANVGSVTSSGNIFMSTNGSILRNTGGALQLQSDASQVILRSNNTTALTLDTSQNAIFAGNVGIGTTTPAQKLHIVSTDGSNIILNSNTAAENNGIFMTEAPAASPYTNGAYVAYDGASNAFKIKTGTTTLSTRLTILRDNGNVGIGVTSPTQKLYVKESGASTIVGIFESVSSGSYLSLEDSTTTTNSVRVGAIGNNFVARAGGSERLRIDSSGNLLVGKTAANLTTTGVEIDPNGILIATKNAGTVAYFNRLTTDGTILDFRKDGSSVGSIGAYNSATAILSGSAGSYSGLYLNTNRIEPVGNNFGSEIRANNTIDIGSSTYKFKDLHLSGTAYVGGLKLGDNEFILAGTGSDLKIGHDGTDNIIRSQGPSLYINANNHIFTGYSPYTEHMRLDTSGNLLVGTTNASVDTGVSSGVVLSASDQLLVGTSAAHSAAFNRIGGASGDIIQLKHNGSTVGSIGSRASAVSYMVLDPRSASNGGVGIGTTAQAIVPTDYAGANVNGTKDLGNASYKWKDLHLSGTANVGAINITGSGTSTFGGAITVQGNITTDGGDFKVGTNTVISSARAVDNVVSVTSSGNIQSTGGAFKWNVDGSGYHYLGTDIFDGLLMMSRADETIKFGSGETVSTTDAFQFWTSTTSTSNLGSKVFSITSGGTANFTGSVGIGTSSPDAKLQIAGSKYVLTNSGQARGGIHLKPDSAAASGEYGGAISFSCGGSGSSAIAAVNEGGSDTDSNGLAFIVHESGTGAADSVEAMRISETGNVGMGTSSPSTKLHLSGADNEAVVRLENSSTGLAEGDVIGSLEFYKSDASGAGVGVSGSLKAVSGNDTGAETDLIFGTSSTARGNNAEIMRLTGDGNIGIGTNSPAESLHTTGNIRFGDSAPAELYTNSSELRLGVDRNNDNGTSNITFYVNNSETARIDASGNVGIGESNLDMKLHISDTTTPGIKFERPGVSAWRIGGTGTSFVISRTSDTLASPVFSLTNSDDAEFSGNVEMASFLSTGNATVEGTFTSEGLFTTDNKAQIEGSKSSATDAIAAIKNKSTTNEGRYLQFLSSIGTNIGQIGHLDQTESNLFISTFGTGLKFESYITYKAVLPCNENGADSDNAIDLGSSSVRFDDVYATNGTIQTSDENEKQDIQALTDAEQRVATACKGLIRRFRWQDSVAEKDDNPESDETARYHFGVIAQDLQDAFTAEGLNASDYGMFISSTWTDDDGVEQTRLGVRYNELLAFIITTL